MTGPEQGFLLLTSYLGDPERKPLTGPQLRRLAQRVKALPITDAHELQQDHLLAIGYDRDTAQHIVQLLSQQEQLSWYLQKAKKYGCVPIARISSAYPERLRQRLGWDSPGCLWAKGDLSLLQQSAVALVGSRELEPLNIAFAQEAGAQAAQQGFVLVSGNARGADTLAQDSCLAHGGKVISVVADALKNCPDDPNVLYLSETGFDLPFSALRALSRNRVIHCLGQLTLVAQCRAGKGGTWDGTTKNLRHGWSPVFCLDDGSDGARALEDRGAVPILGSQLAALHALQPSMQNFIDL